MLSTVIGFCAAVWGNSQGLVFDVAPVWGNYLREKVAEMTVARCGVWLENGSAALWELK